MYCVNVIIIQLIIHFIIDFIIFCIIWWLLLLLCLIPFYFVIIYIIRILCVIIEEFTVFWCLKVFIWWGLLRRIRWVNDSDRITIDSIVNMIMIMFNQVKVIKIVNNRLNHIIFSHLICLLIKKKNKNKGIWIIIII